MDKKLLSNLEQFEKWKLEQIEEYKGSYSPAARTTREIELPKNFPTIVVYDDFDDADNGLCFFYEFVYFSDFNG